MTTNSSGDSSAGDLFIVERLGQVARCTMNRPERMNALEPGMGEIMIAEVTRLLADDEIRVILLRGEGGNFSTGSDLSLLGDNMDPAYLRDIMIRINAFVADLYHAPKPVITEVDGYALGGGLGLALASDLTVASQRAIFCSGFIRIGAVPDMGSTWFLVQRIGLQQAKEMAYSGDMVDGPRALEMGLINRVVPHEELAETALEMARRLARRPAAAMSWTKRCLNRAGNLDLATMLDLEAHVQPLMLLSEEHKKRIRKLLGEPDK